MKKVLLDTNAYTSFLAGEERVLDVLGVAETVYMSAVVLGELFAGFRGGTKERENKESLERFLAKPTVAVLDVTRETAEIFGELKAALKKNGAPIPINDVWIAAHAVETGAVLVSFDAHFQNVPSVRLWSK
jgi:tRNA(fMet)-specific endonuclease VapC